MSLAPGFVEEMLQAGANVDISGVGFGPALVKRFVELARAHGGHIVVASGYAPGFLTEWAKLGGRHVTIKIAP